MPWGHHGAPAGRLDQIAARQTSHDVATVLLAATAILPGSAATGLAASALGGLLQRLWTLPGEMPPAAWLVRGRQLRWDQATQHLKTAIAHSARPGMPHADTAAAGTDSVPRVPCGLRESVTASTAPRRRPLGDPEVAQVHGLPGCSTVVAVARPGTARWPRRAGSCPLRW